MVNSALEPPTRLDGFEVLDATHRRIMAALDTLQQLVSQIERLDGDPQAQAMAASVVKFFDTTARQHHEDEERHVFPALANSPNPQIAQTVARLQQDHRWLEQDWLELSAHLEAAAAGHTGWDSALVREGSAVFIALSHDHIALEESLIYPEARQRMRPADRGEMGREMAARRRDRRSGKEPGKAA